MTQDLNYCFPGGNGVAASAAFVLALVASMGAPSAVVAQVQASHVSAADLMATIEQAPEGRVSDQQIRHFDAGDINFGVGVVSRPVTDRLSAIQHHNQAEIYRVVEGRGILVTSPDLMNAQEADPDGSMVKTLTGPSAFGTIEGGVSQAIAPGDVLFVPAGIAHGFSEITEAITYIGYRIDPDQLVGLKGS